MSPNSLLSEVEHRMGTVMVMMAEEKDDEETAEINIIDTWEEEDQTVVMPNELLMSLREFSTTEESGGIYFIVEKT